MQQPTGGPDSRRDASAGDGTRQTKSDPISAPWRKRWIASFIVIGLVFLAIGWLTRPATLRAIGHWLDVGQNAHPVSAAWVLNGDSDMRAAAAATLVRDGHTNRVVVTTVRSGVDESPTAIPVDAQVIAILNACGVADGQIERIDAQCLSTFDEAVAVNDWLDQHPGATVAIVTNDYHTRRSRWVMNRATGGSDRVWMFAAATDGFSADNWWQNEDGFILYLGELLKFVLYQCLYGRWWGYAAAIMLVAIGAAFGLRRVNRHRLPERRTLA